MWGRCGEGKSPGNRLEIVKLADADDRPGDGRQEIEDGGSDLSLPRDAQNSGQTKVQDLWSMRRTCVIIRNLFLFISSARWVFNAGQTEKPKFDSRGGNFFVIDSDNSSSQLTGRQCERSEADTSVLNHYN